MHEMKLLRDNADGLAKGMAARGNTTDVPALVKLEAQRRALLGQIEQDRAKLKQESEAFGRHKAAGATAPPAQLKPLSDGITQRERQLAELERQLTAALAMVPNIPHASVPAGNASHNQMIRTVGAAPAFSFQPKTHVELGERLGCFDFPRAAKITGANFPLYRGAGARLERALINWMLDVHTREHGYTEISPPFVVNRDSMFGTGQLPKFEEDMYRLKDDDLFLIPTAEVPVTNLHRDEILDEAQLPLQYTAYTPCFRREAGSYGKDTKGLIRVHQFDKVELVTLTTPERSYEEHERLVQHAETILKRLGLHYRVVCLAAGDLGFSAAKCYDLEAWAPGLGQFLEVSSCSNFEAFQARRANIRYRAAATKKVAPVHTLNGSGLALARTVVCLMETHQQADGRIAIPEALRPYLHGQSHLEAA